jgi:hypothetical protein
MIDLEHCTDEELKTFQAEFERRRISDQADSMTRT